MTNTEIKNKLAEIREQIIKDENGVTATKNPEMERICQKIMEVENSIKTTDQTFDPMASIY